MIIVFGKQRLHRDLDQGKAPAPHAGHRPFSASRRSRLVYGTLNLLQSSRQVLGADLNCSEFSYSRSQTRILIILLPNAFG
jgi:hypothetical protein